MVKNLPANAGDSDSIPGSGRSPGEGNGNPLRYSCLENPTNRGAWWATVHGAAKELETTEPLTNNSFKQRGQLGSSKWEHPPPASSGVTIQPHSCISPDSFSRVNMAKGWSGGSGSNRVSQGLGGGGGPGEGGPNGELSVCAHLPLTPLHQYTAESWGKATRFVPSRSY